MSLLISAGSSLGWEHTLNDDVLVFTTPTKSASLHFERTSHAGPATRSLILELKQAYAQTIIQTAA